VECRLDVSPEEGRAVVRIHGRLAGTAVHELERVCREATLPLLLDVTNLMSADDEGIAALRRLRCDGVQLAGASPYLSLLLDLDEA
jgi:hypothetical protein